uniref:VWFA domain-containing protein n=1 Tax=Noctiluca scintillans TaxID=2966 RepID=A0A7S1AWD0_NOCSC
MDEGTKLTALALIPGLSSWPTIQTLRVAHDPQVHVWPPHINILYPFLPEQSCALAAERLAVATAALKPLRIRFRRFGHFGPTAFLEPDCSEQLEELFAACRGALPELQVANRPFAPHLTIGRFNNTTECVDFISSCPPPDIETEVSALSLLCREPEHPFRTLLRVRLGLGELAVEQGESQVYAFRSVTAPDSSELEAKALDHHVNMYQRDDDVVRVVCSVQADRLGRRTESGAPASAKRTIFVVDQSGSMKGAYGQVQDVVRYMTKESAQGKHRIHYVLYNKTAREVTAQEVLESSASGTTNFGAAFEAIQSVVSSLSSGVHVSIVFMTDGQDTASKDLKSSTDHFAEFVRSCGRPVVIHTIGFTQSHSHEFLEKIRFMGTSEGTHRYAKDTGLEESFAQMFDLVDVSMQITLQVGSRSLQCDGLEVDDQVRFDVLVPSNSWEMEEHITVTVTLNGHVEVPLEYRDVDQVFLVRKVDNTDVRTQQDLDRVQRMLSSVEICKAKKWQRQELGDMRKDAQARLDRYHDLFASEARTGVSSSVSLTAELSSLRHEATFSKARRARAMAQRATSNASTVQLMEQFLKALPPLPPDDLASLELQGLCCPLSGESAEEIMQNSYRDFFVFTLSVLRPEDVIDAPTALQVQQVLSGTYSHSAFRSGSEHAIRVSGGEGAHGGFVGSCKHPVALSSEVGLFRGPDGQMMNACLPLYLCESHFARVRVQIKPILGYFFTLDPLGYKGDQCIALFGVLGTMLSLQAMVFDTRLKGGWAEWLIADFTKLCRGLQPLALEYLASGGYTGVVRGDLLEEFLMSPAWRTKERLTSLEVLVGWARASGAEPSPRFHMAFVEELWRRNLTALYKGVPREQLFEVLERLLYGPDTLVDEEGADGDAAPSSSATKDREFSLWARYRRGDLSKKDAEGVRRKYGKDGPKVEVPISTSSSYEPRRCLRYEEAADYLDGIVTDVLGKIRRANIWVSDLFGGRADGHGFLGQEKWIMLIQALRHVGNDVMNTAVAKGTYLNTWECQGEEGASHIVRLLHERFESSRREKWSACVDRRNALLTAKSMLATTDIDAFAGRCLLSCPTRGGDVFDHLVGLLRACSDRASAQQVPLLREKVAALLTGRIGDWRMLADGSSWVHCSKETALYLKEAVGEESFEQIELAMYGTWGHVYRESDIPNRHGHCNSNPNSNLVERFAGFRLG